MKSKTKINGIGDSILEFVRTNALVLTFFGFVLGMFVKSYVDPVNARIALLEKDVSANRQDIKALESYIVPRAEFEQIGKRLDRLEEQSKQIIEILLNK